MATGTERIAWDMFRNCVTDTLGVEVADNAAIYEYWFRFLEEVGKTRVRSLALAFEFEDRATWRALWDVMFKWCIREVRKQVSVEDAAEHVAAYGMGGSFSRSWPASGLTRGDPGP
jgi:hypothetical protein